MKMDNFIKKKIIYIIFNYKYDHNASYLLDSSIC